MRVGIVKPATSARRNKSKDRNKLYEAQLVALSTRFWFAKFCFVSRMTEKFLLCLLYTMQFLNQTKTSVANGQGMLTQQLLLDNINWF